jgi:hypothetical protein
MPNQISKLAMSSFWWLAPAIWLTMILSACGYIETTPYEEPKSRTDQGSFITGKDKSGISLNDLLNPKASGTGSMPVNALLWRASLDTVSVIPIDDIDTFGGTILTEWYPHPEQANQRIKIAVFILDRELRADAIRVNVYLQENQNNNWTDIGIDRDFGRKMEDLILTRAREIRSTNVNAAQ